MKQIENLLRLEMNCKFDTPKKLNRSTDQIPSDVIEGLETGNFTCENIDALAGFFPIFRYRSCITIHGAWPEVTRTRIGGYKNVHQNANGSVEIFYSAIDKAKIERIAAGIAGLESGFRFTENSTSRAFQLAKVITKETFQSVRDTMQPFAERLTNLNIYGQINLYLGADFFRQYLVLDVVPLAVPESEVQNIILQLCNMTMETWQAKRLEADAKAAAEREADKARWQAYADQAAAEKRALLEKFEREYKPLIAHLPECNDITKGVLVKVVNKEGMLKFTYCRIDGKGSFGRVTWSKAYSDTFIPDLSGLEFKEQKQQKLSDLKLKEFRLLQTLNRKAA